MKLPNRKNKIVLNKKNSIKELKEEIDFGHTYKSQARKLNLGCGNDYRNGWTNVDCIKVKKDLEHNLNKFPYPFNNNTFEDVLLKMILEHLIDPIRVLHETIRISKNKAKITIIVPHTRSYAFLTDIRHKTPFTESSFDKELLKEYELQCLILKKTEFIFKHWWKKYMPFKKILNIFLNGIYDDILFEFQVIK